MKSLDTYHSIFYYSTEICLSLLIQLLYLCFWCRTQSLLLSCRSSFQPSSGKAQGITLKLMFKNRFNKIIIPFFLLIKEFSFLYDIQISFSRANISAAAGGLLFFATYLPYQFLRIWDDEINDSIRMGSVSKIDIQDFFMIWSNSFQTSSS